MKHVLIESPFSGDEHRNTRYARACMLDSLNRGEAPFLSHLLYTQVLNDRIPDDRAIGITAGLALGSLMNLTAVYEDLGISGGMLLGIERAKEQGRPIEHRKLGSFWEQNFMLDQERRFGR